MSLAIGLLALAIVVLPGPLAVKRRVRVLWCPPEGPEVMKQAAAEDDPLAVATAFDLLAACLRSGLPMATAAATVADTAPQPLSSALRRAADLLALGAEPATAWEEAASHAETESLARVARRSARSGSSLAAAMSELAAQRRVEAEDSAAAAAERAGVLISGPLGLCFLPAFICLGIVPVVVGLATRVLNGGVL